MNYKRKRPKEHIFGTSYWEDVFYSTGNHRFRLSVRDLRQAQFTDGENNTKKVWRYHNSMLR